MKRPVLASWEDPGGLTCVDILDLGAEGFGFLPCRRDPEDSHGWRPLGEVRSGFDSRAAAEAAARAAFPGCAP